MYQLSHILIEQRNILATMTDGKTSSHLKAESLEAESSTAAEEVENSHVCICGYTHEPRTQLAPKFPSSVVNVAGFGANGTQSGR